MVQQLQEENIMPEIVQLTEQHLLSALLANSPDFIFFKDRQSRFILTNDAHARLLMGLENAEQAIGKTDFDLFQPQEAQRFFDEEQKMMETGKPVLARDWSLHSSTTGEEVWLSEHKVPIRNDAGKVTGMMGISRNITALKRSEQERERLFIELERRTLQLQAALEVSTAAIGIPDPSELIQTVIELIRERFELYYVGLFLVETTTPLAQEPGAWVNLQAGTGQVGKEMVKQKQGFVVGGNSMIGQCIATRKPRVSLDVKEEPIRFKNALLPETRSELALPLIARDAAIGALNIQSKQKNAFTEQDIAVLQTVTNLLSNALENARLLRETENALKELDNLHRSYIRRSWDGFLKKAS